MLAESLKEFKEQRMLNIKRCIIGEWSSALEENDQAAFDEAISDYTISNRQLLRILRDSGAMYSLEALRRHRNEECPCR